ncbi:unnamed protein product [Effrenium voratum]|uniref:Procollagen-proline 4-dioxygenase n=1 Tax=Effrenium voratum TaxID=2562239 RepID=A0AA36NJ23_9DINO|nr:unnamed protein product [Effrenium voratum]
MGLCSASGARLLLATLALSTAYERCGDISNNCYKWSLEGRCEDPSDWAQHGCPLSCGKCKAHLCSARGAHEDYCTVEVDVPDPESGGMHCTIWHKLPGRGPLAVYWVSADGKQLPVGEIFFDKGLGLSTFQDHVFQLRDAGTQEVIAAVRMFPGRIVLTIDEAFLAAIASCDNIPHDTWTGSCDGEAASGGCVTNPGFMTVFCSRSCHACHLRQTEQRCTRRFLDMDQHPALRPGDMNQMFRDIVSRAKKYSYNITVLSKSPWIVTFDNFVSEAEIADMLSNVKEFQRSSDQGEYDEFGLMKGIISSKRTSKTAWCLDTCKASPSYLAVRERISDVIQVPSANFEEMQFLRNYAIGEKYVEHHDMNNISDNDHACGPRIYTFFLYLSDVEEGGETNFPRLNISVKPRKGSALLWPSVLSHNPAVQDARTFHESRPVVRGLKIAANVWAHLFNFEVANFWGCSGGLR